MSDIRPNKLHELASYSVQYDLYMMHPEDFNGIQQSLIHNTDGDGNLQSVAFKFVKNILSTISLKTIALLFHSGWSVERIFRISFQSLNDLENAPGASGPTPKLAPNYVEFQKAIYYLQELDNRDTLSVLYQEQDGQPQLVLKIAYEDKD